MSDYKTPFQKYFVFVGVFFVLIVAIFATWMRDQIAFDKLEAQAMQRFKHYKVYDRDTYLPQLKVASPNGKMVNIIDGQHYTVLNIWATWCAPCVSELPSLSRLDYILSFEKKWRVIAVSIDNPKDVEKVIEFTKQRNLRELAGYQDIHRELQKAIKIKAVPMTLILDRNGKILYEIYGDALWHESSIVSLLRHIDFTE
tara:strand:- start:2744 stop:3340 length:597 start_codon:yes stop_codon:yes gene_type:complete